MATESPKQSPPNPRVAIVALNWNGWRDTLECLESVRHLEYPDFLMIVVDNGSQDDSIGRIKEWALERDGYLLVEYSEATARAGGEVVQEQSLAATLPANRAVLIRSPENYGRTGGVNIGVRYALLRNPSADAVFLLDNDAEVDRDCIKALVEVGKRENAGIVGGLTYDRETKLLQYALRSTLLRFFFSPLVRSDLPLPEESVDCWQSANVAGPAMLIQREVLERIYSARGCYLMDAIFMDGEEFEFCYRSILAGYRSIVTRKGFVWHKGERFARRALSTKRYYYTTRNHMLLAGDFLPLLWWVLFHLYNLPLGFVRILKVLKTGRPDVARAILCGMIDGYKGVKGKWKQHDDREGVQETLSPTISKSSVP